MNFITGNFLGGTLVEYFDDTSEIEYSRGIITKFEVKNYPDGFYFVIMTDNEASFAGYLVDVQEDKNIWYFRAGNISYAIAAKGVEIIKKPSIGYGNGCFIEEITFD